jgi:protein-S-isoprenylcysteine O-methyltransferase Ste14
MTTTLDIAASCVLCLFGIGLAVGIFIPSWRARWGKRGQGAQFSLPSQVLGSVAFLLFAVASFASWPSRVVLPVFIPLFIGLLILCWHDNGY